MNLHRLDLSGGTLAVREWDGEGRPLLGWHALGQAAAGAFAGVMAARLAAHGLHPHAIEGSDGLMQQKAMAIHKTSLSEGVSA